MHPKHVTLTLLAGLCCLGLALPVHAQPVVLNPSFELGVPFPELGWGDIPDWEQTDHASAEIGVNPGATGSPFLDNGVVPDGEYVAFVAKWGDGDQVPRDGAIWQEISGFEAGKPYEVSFAVNARQWSDSAILEVYIDDVLQLGPETIMAVGEGNPFLQRSFEFEATGDTHTLKFNNPHANFGEPVYADHTLLLDAVSVTLIPEPSTLAMLAAVSLASLLLVWRRRTA